jgi:hypothetical protein
MSNRNPHIPSYCHHKAKGLAYVKLGHEFIYLGAYESPESRLKYDRVVTEWLARGRTNVQHENDGEGPAVNTILLAYWKFAQTFYVNPDGQPSLELSVLAKIGQTKLSAIDQFLPEKWKAEDVTSAYAHKDAINQHSPNATTLPHL